MAADSAPEYLTTREIAALLRVKERKVYELAASDEIPCRRVTGKLLFPRAEIEAWLSGDGSATGHERPAVLVGSHDPLLDWALRESGSGMPAFFDGSADGLDRFADGAAVAAGLHLIDDDGDWNVSIVAERFRALPVVLLEWARRSRGLILPTGNPGRVRGVGDLSGRRFVQRQEGAGAQVLWRQLCGEAGLAETDLNLIEPAVRSEADVALAVAQGKADAGLGLECMARQHGLAFVALAEERFDILIWRRAYFEPPLQSLSRFCRSATFAAKAEELGGYDVSRAGTVRFNGA
jgi:excisionase family DNA binding protein